MPFVNRQRATFHKHNTYMHTAICLTTFALLLPAFAQQNVEFLSSEEIEQTVERVKRYTIELIIFAYGDNVSSGTEIWKAGEPVFDIALSKFIESSKMLPEIKVPKIAHRYEKSVDTTSDASFDIALSEFIDPDEILAEIKVPKIAHRYMNPNLTLLNNDDPTMMKIYGKLVKFDIYEPIMRASWTQSIYEKELTAAIELNTIGNPPPGLNGDLMLYLGRYLHLAIDLRMDANTPHSLPTEESHTQILAFGDSRIQNEYELVDEYGEWLPSPIQYRIFEDRIVKNGETRYFDHPKFGVIAKITLFKQTEEENIDDTDNMLPGSLLSPYLNINSNL